MRRLMSRLAFHRHRLADEQGVAIVLAVVIIAIITIAAASAIFYTDGTQRDAFSKKSNQTAYTLAQAALSNATAELLPLYYDDSGQPKDNTTSLSTMGSSWTAPSGSQPSGCTTTDPGTGCSTWTTELCPAGACPSGYTAGMTSAYELAIWHVTGTGAIFNPSGTKPITRTITIDVPLLQPPAKAPAPDIMKSIYVGKISSGCDLSTGQNVVWKSPVYVLGNMCVGQNSGVEAGSQNLGKLNVGGWLETSGNGAHVGTSSTPLSSLSVGGVCTTSSSVPPPSGSPCADTLTLNSGVWTDSDGTIHVSTASDSPTFPAPPSVDFSKAANQGDVACSGQSITNPPGGTFVLNSTAYSCTISTSGIPIGSLSWDPTTSPPKLTISGAVYINGNLITQPATTNTPGPQIVYSGLGNLFVTGTVSFANNTAICVDQVDPAGHDCPDGAGNSSSWDSGGSFPIADNFLMIAAQGDMSGGQSNSNFSIEGGLYSDSNINFGAGHTNIYGPIVTPDQMVPGQQASSGFPNILDLFTGLPGSPQPFWVLAVPQNGTY